MYAISLVWTPEGGIETFNTVKLERVKGGWLYPETEIVFPSDGIYYYDDKGLHFFSEDINHFYEKYIFLVCKTSKTSQFIHSALYLRELLENWDRQETGLLN